MGYKQWPASHDRGGGGHRPIQVCPIPNLGGYQPATGQDMPLLYNPRSNVLREGPHTAEDRSCPPQTRRTTMNQNYKDIGGRVLEEMVWGLEGHSRPHSGQNSSV